MNQADWAKISARLEHFGECWSWTGTKDRDGYGSARIGGRKVRITRPVYEHFMGAIPEGLELDHLCRRPACVNPAHLEPVTHRENVLRGDSLAARWARRSTCHLCGGPFDGVAPDGTRQCLRCTRASARRRYYKLSDNPEDGDDGR